MHSRALSVVLAGLLVSLSAWARPPKLTLFITVDALGSDALWRMRPRLKAGLAQTVSQGAYFPTARYDYAETVTGTGHATLATGANPSRHGIVSNKVLNRTSGKLEPIFADASHPILEAPLDNGDVSPASYLTETLSDRVKLSTWSKGKAISISGKARASIAMGGRLGEAWWFHEGVGKFVTGTYYRKEFPAWVKAFNDKKPADGLFGKSWELMSPAKEYQGDDDRPFESDWYAMGRTFPHPLSGGLTAAGPQSYSALMSSPFGADLLVQFAKAALDGEGLGKDDVPDLLSVSFSSFDRIYHLYGPYSWEAQDAMLRLDKSIADLIAAAEKAAGGRANLLIVLSGDHGGAAIPEEWSAQGLDAARVNPVALEKGLEKELADRFKGGDLVSASEEVDVYLDWKLISDKRLDLPAVRRVAAEWLRKQPDVAWAASRDDLDAAVGPCAAALRAGFHPDRSGDVLFCMRPFHVLESEPAGTSHGAPYAYDDEVPFIVAGKGVKAGFYPVRIGVTDVAPTVAALMEMGEPASAEGTARAEAITNTPR